VCSARGPGANGPSQLPPWRSLRPEEERPGRLYVGYTPAPRAAVSLPPTKALPGRRQCREAAGPVAFPRWNWPRSRIQADLPPTWALPIPGGSKAAWIASLGSNRRNSQRVPGRSARTPRPMRAAGRGPARTGDGDKIATTSGATARSPTLSVAEKLDRGRGEFEHALRILDPAGTE